MPHCKAHLVLFFYSDIPLSNGKNKLTITYQTDI